MPTKEDQRDAVAALISWFQSQDMDPPESVGVMLRCLGVVLAMLARDDARELKINLTMGKKALTHWANDYWDEFQEKRPRARP